MARTGPLCGLAARMAENDRKPSRIQPGPMIAAAVLIAALLALALMDRGPGGSATIPPPGGDGPALQLLPQGRPDAGAAQYGGGRHGPVVQRRRGTH
jgi:hypothetical protein